MNIHLRLNKNTNIFAFNFNIYQLSSIVWFVCLMVFNATFNNISDISLWLVLLVGETKDPEKTIDLSQVTEKLYHIMLYTSPWSRYELTTSVVIDTDCNNHAFTATMSPVVNCKGFFILYSRKLIELFNTNKACEITAEIMSRLQLDLQDSTELKVFHCFLYEPES